MSPEILGCVTVTLPRTRTYSIDPEGCGCVQDVPIGSLGAAWEASQQGRGLGSPPPDSDRVGTHGTRPLMRSLRSMQ